jgi:hypothetical protein
VCLGYVSTSWLDADAWRRWSNSTIRVGSGVQWVGVSICDRIACVNRAIYHLRSAQYAPIKLCPIFVLATSAAVGSAHDKESVEGIEDVFLLYITTFTMLRLEAR